MKYVLMLNYEFPPLGGGAGNATYYLLKEFDRDANLTIDLVTASTGNFKKEQFANNITIHYLDIGKNDNLHHQSNLDLLKYSYKAYRYSRQLIEKRAGKDKEGGDNSFDIIHAFFGIPCGYIAMKLRKKFDVPYIVSLRGSDVPFYSQRFYWLDRISFRRLSKKIWRKASAVVANSQGLKELALKTSAEQAISIIPNGVDIAEFYPKASNEETELLTLVSTGRLIERKGYRFLIEAISGMDRVKAILVGDGPLEQELKDLATKNRANVEFVGKIDHAELIDYLHQADVFCLPSLNEGMSNSILEAMACGLPIITTDTGGSKELIDGNGVVVTEENSDSIREAIERYLEYNNLLQQHSKKSRELAKGMSWVKAAKKYKQIIITNS